MDESRAEYMKGLKRLLDDGEYSDLVIKCQGATYNVHKAIVCSQSEFLAAASRWSGGRHSRTVKRQRNSRGRFTSSSTVDQSQPEEVPAIDLDADDPIAVWAMVQYLYHLEYPVLSADVKREILEKRTPRKSSSSRNNEAQETSKSGNKVLVWGGPNLLQHAKIYSLAEKYGISGLKHYARKRFEDKINSLYRGNWDDVAAGFREVYTGTPDHDRPLRDLVQSKFRWGTTWPRTKAIRDLIVEVPAIAVDIVMAQYRDEM